MYRIVADSSSNIKSETVASVPLKIITDEREFIDDETYNANEMVSYLAGYKGRSGSACPSREDWLDAFGDAQYVFCIAITSHLSGSYNSARLAKEEYESDHPDRHVYVIDSLSTGGEMELIADKLEELIAMGKSFDDICIEIEAYADKARLIFCLKSLTNLVNNGRVSAAAAKISKLLNLRIVGRASDVGELEMHSKPRGDKNAIAEIVKYMKELGYNGGKVIISHCFAFEGAKALSHLIKEHFSNANIRINECGALCSFYAEKVAFSSALKADRIAINCCLCQEYMRTFLKRFSRALSKPLGKRDPLPALSNRAGKGFFSKRFWGAGGLFRGKSPCSLNISNIL